MAVTTAEQRASYPLAAYNFRVFVGARMVSFAKVSGLSVEYKAVTYQHGLSFFEGEDLAKFAVDKFSEVTLERGVLPHDSTAAILEWLADRSPRVVEVHLCDAAGASVLVWRLARAYVVKLTAPTLDARSNDVAIETLTLKAAGITLAPP